MKDHEIREAINELRDTAIKYRDAEQLRSRIAGVVDSIVEKCKPKMIKVEDLKVGDRIRIVATDYHRKPFKNNRAKIIDIALEDFGYIHTINFEGEPKDHTTTLQLQCYQTEFEVLGNEESKNKTTQCDPSDYAIPIYFE